MFGQPQQQQPDCMTQIQAWWSSVTFGVKFIMLAPTLVYLVDFVFSNKITYLLANIPYLTIYEFQLWRLFLTQFVHGQFISLLFSLLSVYFSAMRLEKVVGSAVLLVDMMIKCFLIQVIYTITTFIISLFYDKILLMPSLGMWNLILVYITLQSFSNPDADTQFLCFPVTIKNKYYPIAIVVFINLFQPLSLSPLAAVIWGYLEYRLCNGMLFRPQQATITKIENSLLFRGFNSRPDFIKNQNQFILPVNNPPQHSNATQPEQSTTQFREYAGKGVKIGANIAPNPPSQVMQELQQQAGSNYQNEEDEEAKEVQTNQSGNPSDNTQKKKKDYDKLGEDNA